MDDPDKLRVGDVVRVKNIVGPRMTITGFDAKNTGMVMLKWFNRRYEMESEWFHVRHLAKSNPSTERPMSYRDALIAIREKAIVDNNYDIRMGVEGELLGDFIDAIIPPKDAPTHAEEHADAAE